jgi:hypothetical protein
VFVRDQQGLWSQQAYVKASNPDIDDEFGESIELSGDGTTLAVGAPREASSATGINGDESDDLASWAGAAYVFVREQGAWSQQAYVKASNSYILDGFGGFECPVALSGDGATLAVGSRDGSNATGIGGDQVDNSAALAGAVYLY